MPSRRRPAAGLALIAALLAIAGVSAAAPADPICPGACDAQCPKVCEEYNDTECAKQPWRFMEVCAWDGRRYVNECCAKCAGSSVRAYCAVPLAMASMANANPKLCTLYCSPDASAHL